jgi:subtilase-type serine protease
LEKDMLFKSRTVIAPHGSVLFSRVDGGAGLRRAAAILAAGALIAPPGSVRAADYVYAGPAATGSPVTSSIFAFVTGTDNLTITTIAGGTVTVPNNIGINASAEKGSIVINLGADVVAQAAIFASIGGLENGGAVTITTAPGVKITSAVGVAINVGAFGGGDVDIGGAAGLGGEVSGAAGIQVITSGAISVRTSSGGSVTATAADGIGISTLTQGDAAATNIAIARGSTVSSPDTAINAMTRNGPVTVNNAGTLRGSINGDLYSSGNTGVFTLNNSGVVEMTSTQKNTLFKIANLSGGVLTGAGDFGAVTAESGSFIRAGDRSTAVGASVLRTGALTLAAGATLDVRADYSGAHDSVAVTGAATITNSKLYLRASPQDQVAWLAGGKTFTVLTATEGVVGTFASVTTDLAFLKASAAYTPQAVSATLERKPFAEAAENRVQASVGAALDAHVSDYTNPLIAKLLAVTDGPAALQQVSGAGLSAARTQASSAVGLFSTALSTEMGRFITPFERSALSYGEDTRLKTTAFKKIEQKAEPIPDGRVWAQGLGGVDTLRADSKSGAPSERMSQFGFAAGLDRALSPNLRVGFAGAGGQSVTKVTSLATTSDVSWGQGGLYALMTNGALYAKTSLSVGYLTAKTERTVTAFGTPEKATGEFSSLLYAARIEVGQRFELKPAGVTPFLAFEPSLVAQNAYNEKAATPIALGFGKSTANALPATLGVKLDAAVHLGDVRLTPSATLGWVHNFAKAASISPFFSALPGSTFTIPGAEGDRDLARTELTLEATPDGSTATFYVNARGDLSARTTVLRGAAGAMMRF